MYRLLTAIWPVTVVGLLLGAVSGGLMAQALAEGPPTATILFRIDQPIDPDQIVTDNDPTPET